MPLSLNKLAAYLYKKNFIPLKYFKYEGNCIFLEIVSLITGTASMLYVPSRFTIPISSGENIIELDILDIDDLDTDAYNQNPMIHPSDTYNSVDVIPSNENSDTEELLQLKYKKAIEIKSGKTNNYFILKNIMRQLKRLQYCVDDLPYDLIIYQENYLVYMRNNDPDCYIIKDRRNFVNNRNLRVVTTLDLLYERSGSMDDETVQIVDGIQKILDKNMTSHAKFLDRLISRKGNLLNFSKLINKKKVDYNVLIKKYKTLLQKLDLEEKNIKAEKKKFDDLNNSGFDSELNRSQIRATFERKLHHCFTVKKKIIDILIIIQSASESLSLQADKIFYDNSIMIDKIFKNFDILISISK
jgi:hypothetical protein